MGVEVKGGKGIVVGRIVGLAAAAPLRHGGVQRCHHQFHHHKPPWWRRWVLPPRAPHSAAVGGIALAGALNCSVPAGAACVWIIIIQNGGSSQWSFGGVGYRTVLATVGIGHSRHLFVCACSWYILVSEKKMTKIAPYIYSHYHCHQDIQAVFV